MAWPTNGYVLNSAHNTISQLSSFVMAKEAIMYGSDTTKSSTAIEKHVYYTTTNCQFLILVLFSIFKESIDPL
jgi:hypothetical protein